MGDRANVCIKNGERPAIFLYTHRTGKRLPALMAQGLRRGKGRWDDTPYLARILFCSLIERDVVSKTCYGIDTGPGDNQAGRPILVIDPDNQTVGLAHEPTPTEPFVTVSFAEFVANPGILTWR